MSRNIELSGYLAEIRSKFPFSTADIRIESKGTEPGPGPASPPEIFFVGPRAQIRAFAALSNQDVGFYRTAPESKEFYFSASEVATEFRPHISHIVVALMAVTSDLECEQNPDLVNELLQWDIPRKIYKRSKSLYLQAAREQDDKSVRPDLEEIEQDSEEAELAQFEKVKYIVILTSLIIRYYPPHLIEKFLEPAAKETGRHKDFLLDIAMPTPRQMLDTYKQEIEREQKREIEREQKRDQEQVPGRAQTGEELSVVEFAVECGHSGAVEALLAACPDGFWRPWKQVFKKPPYGTPVRKLLNASAQYSERKEFTASTSQRQEHLEAILPILTAQRDGLLQKMGEETTHGNLERALEKADKEISDIETELQQMKHGTTAPAPTTTMQAAILRALIKMEPPIGFRDYIHLFETPPLSLNPADFHSIEFKSPLLQSTKAKLLDSSSDFAQTLHNYNTAVSAAGNNLVARQPPGILGCGMRQPEKKFDIFDAFIKDINTLQMQYQIDAESPSPSSGREAYVFFFLVRFLNFHQQLSTHFADDMATIEAFLTTAFNSDDPADLFLPGKPEQYSGSRISWAPALVRRLLGDRAAYVSAAAGCAAQIALDKFGLSWAGSLLNGVLGAVGAVKVIWLDKKSLAQLISDQKDEKGAATLLPKYYLGSAEKPVLVNPRRWLLSGLHWATGGVAAALTAHAGSAAGIPLAIVLLPGAAYMLFQGAAFAKSKLVYGEPENATFPLATPLSPAAIATARQQRAGSLLCSQGMFYLSINENTVPHKKPASKYRPGYVYEFYGPGLGCKT